ncbi:MAG: exodeoxyribonuclease VII small subunit [SAR324 cluster bacterium]|nr:exodeoxyribonuclease VII small subunit [SAR324 cluster bacterium]
MAKKQPDAPEDVTTGKAAQTTTAATFEQAMKQLEDAVRRLEDGSLGLEDSLKVFEEGIQWSRQCHQRLADAERKVEMLLKADKEELTQVAFELEEGEGQ